MKLWLINNWSCDRSGGGHHACERGQGPGARPETVGVGRPGRRAAGRSLAVREQRRQAQEQVLVEELQGGRSAGSFTQHASRRCSCCVKSSRWVCAQFKTRVDSFWVKFIHWMRLEAGFALHLCSLFTSNATSHRPRDPSLHPSLCPSIPPSIPPSLHPSASLNPSVPSSTALRLCPSEDRPIRSLRFEEDYVMGVVICRQARSGGGEKSPNLDYSGSLGLKSQLWFMT